MTNKNKQPTSDGMNRTSEVLQELFDGFDCDKVTIGEITEKLSSRSYGILMFVFAMPTLIPMPTPGITAIIGFPLVFITFQQLIGMQSPWFPKWLSKCKVRCSSMRKVINFAVPKLRKVEKILKPRFEIFLSRGFSRFVAAICLLMSVVLLLPIPFGNALPALTLCVFALGLIQRDGLAILAAILLSVASAAAIYMFADVITSIDIF